MSNQDSRSYEGFVEGISDDPNWIWTRVHRDGQDYEVKISIGVFPKLPEVGQFFTLYETDKQVWVELNEDVWTQEEIEEAEKRVDEFYQQRED